VHVGLILHVCFCSFRRRLLCLCQVSCWRLLFRVVFSQFLRRLETTSMFRWCLSVRTSWAAAVPSVAIVASGVNTWLLPYSTAWNMPMTWAWKDFRINIDLLTGHVDLNQQLTLMKVRLGPLYPLCQQKGETAFHLVGRCNTLSLLLDLII